jgi:hypothetical protein
VKALKKAKPWINKERKYHKSWQTLFKPVNPHIKPVNSLFNPEYFGRFCCVLATRHNIPQPSGWTGTLSNCNTKLANTI